MCLTNVKAMILKRDEVLRRQLSAVSARTHKWIFLKIIVLVLPLTDKN